MDRKKILIGLSLAGVAVFLVVFAFVARRVAERLVPAPTATDQGSAAKKLSKNEERVLQQNLADAVKTGDDASCAGIRDTLYHTACVNNIALNAARETGDISVCRKIDDKLIPRSDCEREVVTRWSIEKTDVSVCDEAEDGIIRTECRAVYPYVMATKNHDQKYCAAIVDEGGRQACEDAVVFADARNRKKAVDCALLRGADDRADCQAIEPLVDPMTGRVGMTDPKTAFKACQTLKTALYRMACPMTGAGRTPFAPPGGAGGFPLLPGR